MAIAIALVLIVVASVLFHFVSPWWLTPLASNWRQMDNTLTITIVITGIFFVVINLFVVYTLVRYRHRADSQRAGYTPDNKKLEYWLVAVTTVGIVLLLAPGLVVYADYVRPPKDAMVLEVVGNQWQWRYRLPGISGKLGGSDARFVNSGNPLGLDPDDPAAQDNLVILGNEVYLPLNRPVRVVARSHDVLHDFFVPNFRARMNIVPGMVSSFWFTPTQKGRFEAMCAQLCGVGHPNMHGYVVVVDEPEYQAWLTKQPTFAQTLAAAQKAAPEAGSAAAHGREVAQSSGCIACHTVDGSAGPGPTWKGLFGKTESLADGSSVVVDDAYLARAIRQPNAEVVKGFPAIMPPSNMSDADVAAVTAYIRSLGGPKQ